MRNAINSAKPGMRIRHTGPARNLVKPGLRKSVVRIHAAHESLNKFHWLNRERFHYLEQTLRFLTESLPFRKAAASKYRSTRTQSAQEATL